MGLGGFMLIKNVFKLIIIFSLSFSAQAKVIIWDLGDVLFKQSHFGIASTIGIRRFASYALFDGQSPHIQPLLFEVLGKLGKQQTHPEQQVHSHNGVPLPQIMCDWLAGLLTPQEVIARSHQCIKDLDAQLFFVSEREKQLIEEAVSVIFDPVHFAHHNRPIWQGLKLLKECARYRDGAGNPHILMVLSNWDSHSFDLLYEKHPEVFEHFDHIIISGDIGCIKPHRSCFEHVLQFLQTYNPDLDPRDCFFIDDQLINVRGAEQCNIQGLWLKNGNYRELRKKMKSHGLL